LQQAFNLSPLLDQDQRIAPSQVVPRQNIRAMMPLLKQLLHPQGNPEAPRDQAPNTHYLILD